MRPPARYRACCGPGTLVATAVPCSRAGRWRPTGPRRDAAERRHQAEREHRLVRALQLRHRRVHVEQAFERIADADRQFEEYQAEVVAERRGLAGSRRLTGTVARIGPVGVFAVRAQVAAEAPAAVESSRSLTVQPSARATALTSAEAADRSKRRSCAPPAALEARRGSSASVATRASSPAIPSPWRASSSACSGSCVWSAARSTKALPSA